MKRRPGLLGEIWRLARRDLGHEWILSACLVTAIAGVLAPLLVLFGLKTGVIQAMRAELVEDPVFREIRPAETQNYPTEFFSDIRAQPETEFMIESVLRGASVIRIENGNETSLAVDMLPTGADDPLLENNDAVTPAAGQVVLSAKASESLKADTGDTVDLVTVRTDSGRRREARQSVEVVGVLPLRADIVERAYVPVQLALDIEAFREGFAIPSRGWPGKENDVTPVYDGVIVALDQRLDAIERADLVTNTGFFLTEEMTPEAFRETYAIPPPDRPALIDVSVIDRPAPESAVTRVRRKLVAYNPVILPYVKDIELALAGPDEAPTAMVVKPDLTRQLRDGWIILPQALSRDGLAVGDAVELSMDTVAGPLVFAVKLADYSDGDAAFLAPEFMGVLKRGLERGLIYDEATARFTMQPPGYRGFRLYAKSIDDVQSLQRKIEAHGVETLSQLDAILRIQALDDGLTQIFLLIAALAVVAGALVLLSSQYGAVERKRTSLAHLRLIGFSRKLVAYFPVCQGILLALASIAAGLGVAYCSQWLINSHFAVPLGFDRRMCVISPGFSILAAAGLLALSLLVSAIAARRAMLVDPAEGLRDE